MGVGIESEVRAWIRAHVKVPYTGTGTGTGAGSAYVKLALGVSHAGLYS